MGALKLPALDPADVASQGGSNYPEPFAGRVRDRHRQRLGNAAGLTNFGVNLVTLGPGTESSMRHTHAKQDEFIYVLEGEVTLVTDGGRQILGPGMAAGFPAGSTDAHQLINTTASAVRYLEVGDRSAGDAVVYPDVDMAAQWVDGKWVFTHKDGKPY
jgi:uncharacterized cupin superfamily protein